MVFDFLDKACAEALGVTPEVFIEKIEKIPYKRAEIIIISLVRASINEDVEIIEKVRRIFNLID